ncbi:MAG TPA: hypothetical protein IAB55_02625 [Candidatus Merdivicinus faecavium]|nr:hypothetical protein [Candidatus Merdivicinus faecavium]
MLMIFIPPTDSILREYAAVQRLGNGGLPHLIPKSGILSQHFAQKQLQFPADMV